MIISALSSQGDRMDRRFDGLKSGIKQVDERLEGVERKITGLVVAVGAVGVAAIGALVLIR